MEPIFVLLILAWLIFIHVAPLIALARSSRAIAENEELKNDIRNLYHKLKTLREDLNRASSENAIQPPAPVVSEVATTAQVDQAPLKTHVDDLYVSPSQTNEVTIEVEDEPEEMRHAVPPPLPAFVVSELPQTPAQSIPFEHEPIESPPASATPNEEETLTFEARVGTVWANRIGLVLLAIAAAYLTRVVSPMLSPALKTLIAYSAAWGLFGIGKFFEEKLKRFAQPVMAGALSIAFFVSFAAHFIPPMRCVSLPVSLAWMCAGVGLILYFSDRWKSQYAAGLAIFLGHASALVAARDADTFSLVIIAFLSATSVFMFHRHAWSPLSLFGAVSAYVSHLIWGAVEPIHGSPEMTFWLNFIFLSSYYVIFTASDLLWWARTQDTNSDVSSRRNVSLRAMAPVNLVAYVSIVTFLYIRHEQFIGSIEWYFFAMAGVQAVLAWKHRRYGNPDWALYPALSVIFLTIGFFNAFGALTLNMVLAAEAIILLIAAHRTRLWVFHALAQGAMTLNFIHYWIVQAPPAAPDMKAMTMLGGLLVAGVYFLKSQLEEIWYGSGVLPWHEAESEGRRGPISRALSAMLDEVVGPFVPYFAHAHAAAGGVVIIHQIYKNLAITEAATMASVIVLTLTALALFRRSIPLLWGYIAAQIGLTMWIGFVLIEEANGGAVPGLQSVQLAVIWAGWIAPLSIILVAPRRMRDRDTTEVGLMFGHAGVALTMISGWVFLLTLHKTEILSNFTLLGWAGAVAVLFAIHDRLRDWIASRPDASRDHESNHSMITGLACCAGSALLALATLRCHGFSADAVYTMTVWLIVMLFAGAVRHHAVYFVSALIMLVITHVVHYSAIPNLDTSIEPVATLWLMTLTLGLASGMDIFRQRKNESHALHHEPFIHSSNYLLYLLGLALTCKWLHDSFGFPLASWLMASGAIGMLFTGRAVPMPCARRSSYALVLFSLGHAWIQFLLTHSKQMTPDPMIAVLGLLALAIGYERLLNRPRYDSNGVLQVTHGTEARLAIVIPAILLALAGIYASPMIGANRELATAGWGALGAALMISGFIFSSPMYRRIALVLFAVCLARLFLVDAQRFDDTFKVIAFFALGACLLGVAWLYSRFSKEFRKWL